MTAEQVWAVVMLTGAVAFVAGWPTTLVCWLRFVPCHWPGWAYALCTGLIGGGLLVAWISAGVLEVQFDAGGTS